MAARVESQWTGESGQVDLQIRYPAGGGSWLDIEVDSTCDTAATLAVAIEDALNDAVAGTPFSCIVSAATGKYQISSSGSAFDIKTGVPIRQFCSFDADGYNLTVFGGGTYPPSQFRSLAPLPEPEPLDWDLDRHVARSPFGRVEARLADCWPLQEVALEFGDVTGSQWENLAAWLEYATMGGQFSLYRSTDSTLYKFVAGGSPNWDGRSLCVLTAESRQLARVWQTAPAMVSGWLTLTARILEGY